MRLFQLLPLIAAVLVSSQLLAGTEDAGAADSGIDLKCQQMKQQFGAQLVEQDLLQADSSSRTRLQKIVWSLCVDAQQLAQQQHEKGKQAALDNWLFEDMGGKPGNNRLKRLKH